MSPSLRMRLAFIGIALLLGISLGILLGVFRLQPRFDSAGIRPAPQTRTLPRQTAAPKSGLRKPVAPGRWREADSGAPARDLDEAQTRAIRQLESLGYLAGSHRAEDTSGVTIHDKAKAWEGLNLVVSGHAPEALLTDMSGQVLHKWRCEFSRAMPKHDSAPYNLNRTFWRRAYLLPNGDLLAVFERIGLIRIDKDSKLVWALDNRAHHDIDVDKDGNIYVLCGKGHIVKDYNPNQPIWEDYIVVLDSDGNEMKRVSILEALLNSDFSPVLGRAKPKGDILHSNTVELIRGRKGTRSDPLRNGTVLTSVRELDLVGAVDLEEEKFYWAESDLWHRQHEPTLLDNGNMLVFDNMHTKTLSAVIEFEPVSREVVWSYVGGQDGEFFSGTCGSQQRLPNGNTLIVETDRGHAFEVTPDKTIVWEYVSPYRAGEHNETVASLFDVVRFDRDYLEFTPDSETNTAP